MAGTDFAAGFSGSVPESYDRLLVPLIFQHYAEDMALRAAKHAPRRVLELAAGTGAARRAPRKPWRRPIARGRRCARR